MADRRLRVLLLEDDPASATLAHAVLASYDVVHFELLAKAEQALQTDRGFDVALVDLNLPDASGLDTVTRLTAIEHAPPVVVLTGSDDPGVAEQVIRAGAQDLMLKTELASRALPRVIRYAMDRRAAEQERLRLIAELREALAAVKALEGFLPICASCRKIRDDQGYWTSVEEYVQAHAGVTFSHGLCQACLPKYFPDEG